MNKYKKQLNNYTKNMLNFELAEQNDNLKIFEEDLKFEDDEYLISRIKNNIKITKLKIKTIKQFITKLQKKMLI